MPTDTIIAIDLERHKSVVCIRANVIGSGFNRRQDGRSAQTRIFGFIQLGWPSEWVGVGPQPARARSNPRRSAARCSRQLRGVSRSTRRTAPPSEA